MMKTVEDICCSKEVGLAWAVSATNAIQNCNAFSPNQLVYGRNISLPSIMTDKPPAFKVPTIDIVRKHLEAIKTS